MPSVRKSREKGSRGGKVPGGGGRKVIRGGENKVGILGRN